MKTKQVIKTPSSTAQKIFRFFPFLLLLALVKHNRISMVFWLLLWGIVSGSLFAGYGLFNLYLYPEYLGTVDFTSHAILGFSLGGFIMAFNMTGYILHGAKFPLIATLNKPFLKYCLNNFIVPGLFLVYFTIALVHYQLNSELDTFTEVAYRLAGFYSGVLVFVVLTLTYFFSTNLNLDKLLGIAGGTKNGKNNSVKPMRNLFSRNENWRAIFGRKGKFWVHTYLSGPLKIALARDSRHYDARTLKAVFSQNHINASLFELVTVISIVFFSLLRETPVFQLPAAASITLLLTVILMFAGAVYSWLKDWSFPFFIVLVLLYNFISSHPDYSFKSYAYGLKYSGEQTVYNDSLLTQFAFDSAVVQSEKAQAREMLLKRISNLKTKTGKKPKLVFINCSGGGLRATMWTYRVMQHLDSTLNGKLLDYSPLINGSSGGMWGAAYYREMYRQSLVNSGINPTDSIYLERIGSEVLNNIALSFALHDWLIRTRKFTYAGESYTKDRGLAFERKFSLNTAGVLDKKISDYSAQVKNAEIPQMILSPTIANDGKRLLISSVPVSYLTAPRHIQHLRNDFNPESVDYRRLFENQNPDSLRLLSALRMSSTFFYVLPNVTLPAEPAMEVLDAGVRDNTGMLNTIRFLDAHSEVINEHTSGAVVVQIHDKYKKTKYSVGYGRSFLRTLSAPLRAVYGNYLNMQNYTHDELLSQTALNVNDLDVVRFELMTEAEDDISLSWRLTNKEKNRIKKAIHRGDNRVATEIVKELVLR